MATQLPGPIGGSALFDAFDGHGEVQVRRDPGDPFDHRVGSPIRAEELAVQLGILPRSATSVLDALEAAGLVQRRPDRRDRRGVIVDLTADGQEMAALLTSRANTSLTRRIQDELTAQEQADLHDVLHRLAHDWPGPDDLGTDRRRPPPFGPQ